MRKKTLVLVCADVGTAVGTVVVGILAGIHAIRKTDAGPATVKIIRDRLDKFEELIN